MVFGVNMSRLKPDEYLFDHAKYKPVIISPLLAPLSFQDVQQFHDGLSTASLTARVQLVTDFSSQAPDPNCSTYNVDNTLYVTVPSDPFRSAMVDHWEAQRSSFKNRAWVAGGITVLCAAKAALAKSPHPLAITALAIGSIVALIFTALSIHQASKASHQKAGWSISPAHKIAEERKRAFEKGFKYAYENNLKLMGPSNQAVLLPEEIGYLFDQYFDQFCQELRDQQPASNEQKKAWIDTFRSYNPISNKLLSYVAGCNIPIGKYAQVSLDFESMANFLENLHNKFKKLRKKRNRQTEEIIKGINEKRELVLNPFKFRRDLLKEKARQERDTKLAKLNSNNSIDAQKREESEKEINNEYSNAVNGYELCYTIATTPADIHYNSKVGEAQNNLEKILEKIKTKEAAETALHYDYARRLLEYVWKLKKQQDIVSFPHKPELKEIINIPEPSAPPIEFVDFIEKAQAQQPTDGISSSQYAEFLQSLHSPTASSTMG